MYPYKTKILSTGEYLPSEIVKSGDLFSEIGTESKYDIPTYWMSEKMGIVERRMASEDTKPSDLAIPTTKDAISNSGIDASQIDIVILCGIERDQPEPATAHTVQDELGLKAAYAFDIANACFGFIDGMNVASRFINSGIARYVSL